MRIGELAQKTGVSIHTIRYYESLGLIEKKLIRRLNNNYKSYDEKIVSTIRVIKAAKSAGFTLNQIADLMKEGKLNKLSSQSKRELLESKLDEIDRHLHQIQAIRDIVLQKLQRCKN